MGSPPDVQFDVLLDTFGTRWSEVLDGALAAEEAGFDGIWVNDHLAGSSEGASHVLECWTVLSALAATVPRVAIGPLVLNVANRDPGTLAVMAATLQEVSVGRLLLGLGAGARPRTPYAVEQEALGRRVAPGAERRLAVERAIAVLRRVWSDGSRSGLGFLQPRPVPPIVVAGLGPKMAEVAGRFGDGICIPAGPMMAELVGIARRAHAGSGSGRLLVTASVGSVARVSPVFDDGRRLATLGVDRLIVYVAPPFRDGLARLGRLRQSATSQSS